VAGYENSILYHYTDFQALDGILRCAQLRVNNVLNMNDAAEMRLFMSGLCQAVVNRLKKKGDMERAAKVRLLFQEELKKEFFYSAYAACFSLYRDDAAQWERYGNRGRGVCIAFRGDYLEKMAEGELSLQKVFYQEDMTEHALVDVFYRMTKGETDLTGSNPRIKGVMKAAWIQSVVFKHPSFSSEKEVRLVVSPFEKEFFDVEPCYHVSVERIKKYYPLDLKSMCQRTRIHLENLVSEIIIGPESTQSLSILQDYLRDNDMRKLAERVSLSNCPLRRPVV
jgi:hypothetical protein